MFAFTNKELPDTGKALFDWPNHLELAGFNTNKSDY